jgi:hypothetical protein
MDETIAKFTTPESCEQFAVNVEAHSPERAKEARRRAVELRAAQHGAATAVEREALEAVYAYQRALTQQKGKTTHASRTWQMIKKHGIINAVERVVSRTQESAGYRVLAEMGMERMAFEAVVLRHPEVFSAETVERSKERMRQWSS